MTGSSRQPNPERNKPIPGNSVSQLSSGRLANGFLLGVGLVFLILLVFGRLVNADFINYDDTKYVIFNPHVQAGLTFPGVAWAFSTFDCSNWHPLTWLSLQLDTTLFGSKPLGFHLTNIVLHALTALLLFGVLWKMTGAKWRSWLVAVLFAVHPLHVESVAWVAERKDVLSGLFWMLTMWTYLLYIKKATASEPNFAFLDVLAAAQAEAGRFDDAVATMKKALKVVPVGASPERTSACFPDSDFMRRVNPIGR
jgi:hypothetical protein